MPREVPLRSAEALSQLLYVVPASPQRLSYFTRCLLPEERNLSSVNCDNAPLPEDLKIWNWVNALEARAF